MNLRRYWSPRLMARGALSKEPILRSERHLEWVRSRPCVSTGRWGVDAHHVLRRSHGVNDYTAIALTHEEHMRLHTEGEIGICEMTALIATLIERVIELERQI